MAVAQAQKTYGLPKGIFVSGRPPVVRNGSPTAKTNLPVGTFWFDPSDNALWYAGSYNSTNKTTLWVEVSVQGGGGDFSSLVVNPGPTSLTGLLTVLGTTIINASGTASTAIGGGINSGSIVIGNSTNNTAVDIISPDLNLDSSAAGAINIGNALVAGNLFIGGVNQTGLIELGTSTAGQTISIGSQINVGAQVINIANGAAGANSTVNILSGNATAGVQTLNMANGNGDFIVNLATNAASVNDVIIGSTNAASTTTIRGGQGLGGISLNALGYVNVVAVTDTQASPTVVATADGNVGSVTFTGFTTASAATEVFTITNDVVLSSSQVLLSACNEGSNDAQMTVTRIDRIPGSLEVTLTNNGAAALNGDITISFWLLNS